MNRHVLFIPAWYPTPWDRINGISFRNQAIALKKHGHRAGVIAPQHYSLREFGRINFKRGYDEYMDEGIPTLRFYDWAWLPKIPYGNSTLWIRAGMNLLDRYIKAYGRPDLIHASCVLMAGILASKIKRRYGMPYVLAEYGNPFDLEHYKFPRWLYKLIGESMQHYDALIVPSDGVAEFMKEKFDAPIDSAEAIPIAVDSCFFDVELTELNPKDGIFKFLSVGNLNPNKGHADLVEAFSVAFRDNPNVRLKIVGEGPQREVLEQMSASLGVSDQVGFSNRLSNEELTREMAACNALVLPSRYETLGTVLAEAMACGKPVIATNTWGPLTIVKEDCGVIVPSKNPKSMGMAMSEMVSNIDQYDPQKIRKYCVAHFAEDAVCKKLTSIYQRILDHRN